MFSVSSILLSAVSGSGNTAMSLFIEIITISFYLFATYVIAIYLKLNIEWVWSVEYVYFLFMGGVAWLYLRRAKRTNFGTSI
jgi:MATE family multidrug resistance protein